jgi:hypothetical protein
MQNSLIRQIIALGLVTTIALHLFTDLAILISFKINQDYIAEFLCIEKDIPDSACQGCCQLEKKLDEQEEQKQELPESSNRKSEIQFFSTKNELPSIPQQKSRQLISMNQNNYNLLTSCRIFHPPKS